MKKNHVELVLEWSEKIHKKASGKSIAAWCREEGVSYTVFLYWHKRLQEQKPSQIEVKRSSFLECPHDSDVWVEIILEGAKLTLSKNFDRASLLFYLKLFGRALDFELYGRKHIPLSSSYRSA